MRYDEEQLEKFLFAIGKYASAYSEHEFRYFAVRTSQGLRLLKGRLYLRPNVADQPPPFEAGDYLAGHFSLTSEKMGHVDFARQLLGGKVDTPVGTFIFPTEPLSGGVQVSFKTLHELGLNDQARLALFTARAEPYSRFIEQPETDWQMMASPTPYQHLQELLIDYGIGIFTDDQCTFEIAAMHVIGMDRNSSSVSGEEARLTMLMAPGLDPSRAALNFKVEMPGRPTERHRVPGDALTWTRRDHGPMAGTVATKVPEAAVVLAIATYDGQAHAFYWFADPAISQNPKRAIYESTDPELALLNQFLVKADQKGNNARNLESGVAWLLWMLGFGVLHLGSTPGTTQDAADVIATTPTGHVAVVECTTGLLKADKLGLLVSRAAQFRERIARTGQKHLRVLSVFVTSRTREEVRAGIEPAQREGVLVLTQEDLLAAIPRTLLLPNPEALYTEAEESANAAQQRALGSKDASGVGPGVGPG